MQNTRIDKLLEFYNQNPKDSFVVYALATEFVAVGDDEKALTFYLDLLITDPDYVATYYHLGKLYARRGQEAEALATYKTGMQKALAKKDNHSFAELQNAHTNLELGLYED